MAPTEWVVSLFKDRVRRETAIIRTKSSKLRQWRWQEIEGNKGQIPARKGPTIRPLTRQDLYS